MAPNLRLEAGEEKMPVDEDGPWQALVENQVNSPETRGLTLASREQRGSIYHLPPPSLMS